MIMYVYAVRGESLCANAIIALPIHKTHGEVMEICKLQAARQSKTNQDR